MSVHTIESVAMLNGIIDACEEVKKLLVIKCGATWCGPCRMIKPKYQDLANEFSNQAVFVDFDVEEIPELAEQLEITAMPTFVIIKGRKVVKKSEGADLYSVRNVLEGNI